MSELKLRPPKENADPRRRRNAARTGRESGEEDGGFGFDDEEGVAGGVAGVAELLEGVVEGGGLDGEDYGAVVAAYEVEAEFGLDEF